MASATRGRTLYDDSARHAHAGEQAAVTERNGAFPYAAPAANAVTDRRGEPPIPLGEPCGGNLR
jgi:hypothetical protein